TTDTVPVRDPVTVGVKVMAIAQFAPTATVVPQLFTAAKSPATEIDEIARAPVPMLVRNTNCGGDVVETVWLPKPTVAGNSARPEPAGALVMVRGAAGNRIDDGAPAAVRAVVETVSVDRTGLRPGVTVGGLNVQVVCGGRLPLA